MNLCFNDRYCKGRPLPKRPQKSNNDLTKYLKLKTHNLKLPPQTQRKTYYVKRTTSYLCIEIWFSLQLTNY